MDPIPDVRAVAARAIGSLIRGMGEDSFPDLVSWLMETLKSDNSNVERSGAAQGLSEVNTKTKFSFYLCFISRLSLSYCPIFLISLFWVRVSFFSNWVLFILWFWFILSNIL